MAWYLWLVLGVALGAGGVLVVGWRISRSVRAADVARRLAVQRQQYAAERQLQRIVQDAVRSLIETARGGAR